MVNGEYRVVSFSGGKDSTAMLLRLMELGAKIDEVVCCDTTKEFPAMYRHIEKVRELVEGNGIKFTMLRSPLDYDYYMFEHQPNRKNPELLMHKGHSWAGPRARWCTSRLKTDIINGYCNDLARKTGGAAVHFVGIAYDEQDRLQRKTNQEKNQRHPLVGWKWTEDDCLEYCYSKGFDWEGLYEIFDRVSCWCCPLQPLKDLRNLRRHFPDLWSELIDMDERTWRQFQKDYTVKQLDARFALEDQWEAEGKNTKSREFYRKVNKEIRGESA